MYVVYRLGKFSFEPGKEEIYGHSNFCAAFYGIFDKKDSLTTVYQP